MQTLSSSTITEAEPNEAPNLGTLSDSMGVSRASSVAPIK